MIASRVLLRRMATVGRSRIALSSARTTTARRSAPSSAPRLCRSNAATINFVHPQRFGHQSDVVVRYYSVEKVLQLRGGDNKPKPTLYTPELEKENCGVGLIASLASVPSRKVVEYADTMLQRMHHRGGVGSDPASGDGSGRYRFGIVDGCRKGS
jgi:hypothetical protein